MAMRKPITSASIRRSYTGARSRAEGAGFENLINQACDYYSTHGVACIDKTPEPMKPLGGADRSGRFLACYTKQAQPDYKGVLDGGKAVVFEAKHTSSEKMGFERVKINSTKSMIGHLLGAAGAVEFVTCVKEIEEGYVHATVGLTEPDDELDLDYCMEDAKMDVPYALSNSLGFGGHNASILVKKYV